MQHLLNQEKLRTTLAGLPGESKLMQDVGLEFPKTFWNDVYTKLFGLKVSDSRIESNKVIWHLLLFMLCQNLLNVLSTLVK